MKIAILLGSIRKGRESHKIGLYLKQILSDKHGIEVEYLDLVDYDLPFFQEQAQVLEHEELKELGTTLAQADAMIFITPEYHGSYSGALKNTVDHFWKEFSKKVIGVVVTGSGKFGGINASSHLQQLILSLGAFPIPTKLVVPFIQHAFGADLQPRKKP